MGKNMAIQNQRVKYADSIVSGEEIITGESIKDIVTDVEGVKEDIEDLEAAVAGIHGLPSGGTAGQVLSKIDGTDYNAEWADPASGGMDVIEISTGSGTMSDDDFAKLGPNCVVKYIVSETEYRYYYYESNDSTYIIYGCTFLVETASAVDRYFGGKLRIRKDSKTYLHSWDNSYLLKSNSPNIPNDSSQNVIGLNANNAITKESASHFRIPAGGTAGQVLSKVDGTDYNIGWATPSGGGGSSGHTLTLTMQSGHSVVVYYADGTSETVTANATKSNVVGFKITNSDNMNDISAGIVFGWDGTTTSFYISGWTVDEDTAYLLLADTTLGLHGMG